MRTSIRITLATVAAAALAAGCGSVTTGSGRQAGRAASQPPAATQPSPPADTAPAAPAPPAPNPDGTYSGSCDYTLSSDFNSYPAVAGTLIGEIDLDNTGNIGTVIKTKITWPQLGYAPIAMTKTVRTRPGQSRAVRFHYTASGDVIDRLQAWQDGHNYRDGCTYRAAMVDTFGQAH